MTLFRCGISNLYATLAFGLLLSYATAAKAQNVPEPTLRVDITNANPGSLQRVGSTPVFFSTAHGQLVMVQGNLDDSNDSLASDDQGRTWHKWEAYSTWPKIFYQDVVRQGNELLAFGLNDKDAMNDAFKGTHVWWSSDEGKTWAGGNRLTPDTDRWVTMINRVLLTGSGRAIVPIDQLFGREGPDPCKIGSIYSDDAGRSWKRSPIFGPPPGYPVKPEGLGEPAVVELANGKIWMVCRGVGGHLWQVWSDDGGATWGTPSPTTLVSPLSAVNAKRIPGSNTVVVFWNNAKPGTSEDWNDPNNFWRPRSPLVFAVSKDNCKTWSRPATMTTGTATYPAICFLGDKMYVEFWEDPDPKAVYGNAKSHLILLAYDIASLLQLAGEPITYIQKDVPKIDLPAYEGTRYEAVVPDTLDLAERATLAVNGLTGPLDPAADYELYWRACFHRNPPIMAHDFNDHVQVKFHESLPLMRLISGSRQSEEVDKRWMEVVMQMQGPDGLLYYPLKGRPWAKTDVYAEQTGGRSPAGDHFTEPFPNGRLLGAIALYYKTTGDDRWKEAGKKIVDGLTKQAVHRDDYAFFSPALFGVNEVCDANAPLPEPWTGVTCGWVAIGLAQFYNATGYEPALALSGKLARFTRDHCGVFEADGRYVGIDMHFHGHLHPLLGMLEYGIAAHDREMIDFARKGYEFGVKNMNPIVGYVPETISPKATSEICGVADMISLAVKLSLAGASDYWDDVDRWTRNQFAEGQLTSTDWVKDMTKEMPANLAPVGPNATIDRVSERCVGGFAGWPSANDWQQDSPGTFMYPGSSIMHCCTGNGTRAIYYVWENLLQYKDGKLKVNLLLNRASPWADVDSSIPYEGRVDVNIKTACELSIRIPEWVKPEESKCQVNGTDRPLSREGRYAVVGKVEPKAVVTITFPIFERTDKVQIQGNEYTLIRKGNDVVHIDPPGKYCPLYQREKYRENRVRTKTVERFVAEKQIEW